MSILVVWTETPDQIATLMQEAAGQFARGYNRRQQRSGAFWQGRYHATMVDSREYLWKCLLYVELNMVRRGVVRHPAEWAWSGYGEWSGLAQAQPVLGYREAPVVTAV